MTGSGLVIIATQLDPMDAHILRARLEAEGVPAHVLHEHHVRLNWFQAMALGGAKVVVAADDVGAARQVIEALARGDFALPDDPLQADACSRCGSTGVVRDDRSRAVSLWGLFFLGLPLPFSHGRLRCTACGMHGGPRLFSKEGAAT